MLHQIPSLEDQEAKVIARIEAARQRLRHNLGNPRRWHGLLARVTRARALRASNSIEGIHVSNEDAIAAIDGEDPADADRDTWLAVMGYRQAMDFILQRCQDPNFRFSSDLILALHFMITQHNLDANPGQLRPGWVCVRNTTTGEIVHEGADRDLLEPLVDEYVGFLNGAHDCNNMVKAAMAHLVLTLIHPFSDGNGRLARCIQTAVLASDGVVSPIFSSIEEYTGRNVTEYYDVLAKVGGGAWHPENDARPWLRFCLTAHYRQAQTTLRRIQEVERVFDDLAQLLMRRKLPERMGFALSEAAFGYRVRNSSYRVSADISSNLASRDLKTLVDEGLLERKGEKRGAHYTATLEVQKVREKHKLPKAIPDPFELPDEDPRQPSLFEVVS
ncbi:MAG: Fic family protein [Kiloniellales bacterium]|nr:Fic family protein [Kiloniellales bacterium]